MSFFECPLGTCVRDSALSDKDLLILSWVKGCQSFSVAVGIVDKIAPMLQSALIWL